MERQQWGRRSGFILASIGSAVGLGNIWRFSYVAGENGGGAFLMVYLCFALLIGIPLVMAELAVGKRGAADAITSVERLAPASPWRWIGWLGAITAVLLLSYYAVIAGWALRYFWFSAEGGLWANAGPDFAAGFEAFAAGGFEPVAWQLAMMLGAVLVVGSGIARGIERASLLLMPLLALLVGGLAIYSLTLPGSAAGVAFLFAPDWSAVTEPRVLVAALGQAFFSIGVGAAVFVTFGSYMRQGFGIAGSAGIVVLADTLFAMVAGLAIFPAVFAFGGSPAGGPQLAFVALPQVFLAMPAGGVVGTVFFLLLSAAALTSMLSLLEVAVAAAMQRLNLRRWPAVLWTGGTIALLGLPSALSYGVLADVRLLGLAILDAVDALVSNLLLPLSGLALAAFLGWAVAPAERAAATGLPARLGRPFAWLLRLAALVIAAPILVRLLAWVG